MKFVTSTNTVGKNGEEPRETSRLLVMTNEGRLPRNQVTETERLLERRKVTTKMGGPCKLREATEEANWRKGPTTKKDGRITK